MYLKYRLHLKLGKFLLLSIVSPNKPRADARSQGMILSKISTITVY